MCAEPGIARDANRAAGNAIRDHFRGLECTGFGMLIDVLGFALGTCKSKDTEATATTRTAKDDTLPPMCASAAERMPALDAAKSAFLVLSICVSLGDTEL